MQNSARAVLVVSLSASLVVGGGCESQYPPVPRDQRELVDGIFGIMDCVAAENPTRVDLGPGPTANQGEVLPADGVACGRSLFERDQIQVVPRADIGRACQGIAEGCTLHDFSGCGGDIVRVADDLFPTTLTTVEGNASSVDLGGVLYHEAMHTVQARLRGVVLVGCVRVRACIGSRRCCGRGLALRCVRSTPTRLGLAPARPEFSGRGLDRDRGAAPSI